MKRIILILVLLIGAISVVCVKSCKQPKVVNQPTAMHDLPLHEQLLYLTYSNLFLRGWESQYKNSALIDDVAGGAKTGYKLIKVDGNEVKRLHGAPFLTVVPYAIVSEGKHEFLFEKDWDVRGPKNIFIIESIQAKTFYRLKRKWGKFKLVVDKTHE